MRNMSALKMNSPGKTTRLLDGGVVVETEETIACGHGMSSSKESSDGYLLIAKNSKPETIPKQEGLQECAGLGSGAVSLSRQGEISGQSEEVERPSMDKEVSIKVNLRLGKKNIVKRFAVSRDVSFEDLKEKIKLVFSPLLHFSIGYTDDDGDGIEITTDIEVAEMIKLVAKKQNAVIRLHISVKSEEATSE